MELDKEIETPFGPVRFKGEITEEEFDYIVKAGLLTLFANGKIKAHFVDDDGNDVDTQMDLTGPENGEQVH